MLEEAMSVFGKNHVGQFKKKMIGGYSNETSEKKIRLL